MTNEHFVIIGNGATGNRAADAIRKRDKKSRITIISDEFFPFYYRHLLCEYLVDIKSEEELVVRPPSYYKEHNIRLRLGQKVVKVDLNEQTLYLQHMEKVNYTKLLLANGGIPKIPEIHFAYQEHFTTFKTLADARRLKPHLSKIKHVFIIGGDLISLRVANVLLKNDIDVSFLLDGDSFWPLELTDKTRQKFTQALTKRGIHVLNCESLTKVSKKSANKYVVTTANDTVKTNMIGAFFGIIPDIQFLLGSGLDLERGIIVDENLQTNIKNVFAAGDCAQVYNPEIRNYWVSVGWNNAEKLGEIAGRNMLGEAIAIKNPKTSTVNLEGIKVTTPWWKEF